MKKKIIKHGKNLTLILDKKIISALGLAENSTVDMRIENGKIIIEPMQENAKKLTSKQVIKKAEKIMSQYDVVFKKLSKT